MFDMLCLTFAMEMVELGRSVQGRRSEVAIRTIIFEPSYDSQDYKCRRKALVLYQASIDWVINPTSTSLWSSGQPLTWLGPKCLIEHKHQGTFQWLPKNTQILSGAAAAYFARQKVPVLLWAGDCPRFHFLDGETETKGGEATTELMHCQVHFSQFRVPIPLDFTCRKLANTEPMLSQPESRDYPAES